MIPPINITHSSQWYYRQSDTPTNISHSNQWNWRQRDTPINITHSNQWYCRQSDTSTNITYSNQWYCWYCYTSIKHHLFKWSKSKVEYILQSQCTCFVGLTPLEEHSKSLLYNICVVHSSRYEYIQTNSSSLQTSTKTSLKSLNLSTVIWMQEVLITVI